MNIGSAISALLYMKHAIVIQKRVVFATGLINIKRDGVCARVDLHSRTGCAIARKIIFVQIATKIAGHRSIWELRDACSVMWTAGREMVQIIMIVPIVG